jgi:hypothetical protein
MTANGTTHSHFEKFRRSCTLHFISVEMAILSFASLQVSLIKPSKPEQSEAARAHLEIKLPHKMHLSYTTAGTDRALPLEMSKSNEVEAVRICENQASISDLTSPSVCVGYNNVAVRDSIGRQRGYGCDSYPIRHGWRLPALQADRSSTDAGVPSLRSPLFTFGKCSDGRSVPTSQSIKGPGSSQWVVVLGGEAGAFEMYQHLHRC